LKNNILNNLFAKKRLTINEFEHSKIRCGFHFVFNSVYFDDAKSEYPSSVSGGVQMERGTTPVLWNKFGEAFIKGKRFDQFDLISPLIKENYSQIFVIAGLILSVLLITILYFLR
jgi:hypothetical protein